MSTDTEQNNDHDKDKDNNDKKNNQSNENNQDIKELLKIPFVKDLLVKIDVLKNGIIKERQKTNEQAQKIKEIEEELTKKSEQLQILIQEKAEFEKKKKEKEEEEEKNKNNKNRMTSMANEEIRKLNEEITKLKFENETFLQNMNKTLLESEDSKLKYKEQIKDLTDKNNSLSEEIQNLKSEKQQLEDKVKQASYISTDYVREKQHFDTLLREYKKAKEEAIHQLNACLEKCSKLVMENKTYKDSIALRDIDAGKMAQKLAEYKNTLIKVNMRNQVYHVKKVGLVSNTEIDIIFALDENGNFIMRIDEKGNSDTINIQDVESVNLVDRKKNKVEVIYMYKGKKININVLVNELVIDQFVDAYKNFYTESMKHQC